MKFDEKNLAIGSRKRVLAVLPEVHFSHISRRPKFVSIFKFWATLNLKKAISLARLANVNIDFLYPEAFESVFGQNSEANIPWRLVRGMGNTRYEKLHEIIEFQGRAIAVLKEAGKKVGVHPSIPDATRFALITPHAEDFPFFVGGLMKIFEEYDEIWIFDGSEWHAKLALEVAKEMGRSAKIKPAISFRMLNMVFGLRTRIRFALSLFVFPAFREAPRRVFTQGAPVIVMGKDRMYQFLEPIIARLEDLKIEKICGIRISASDVKECSSLTDGLSTAEFRAKYRSARSQAREVWLQAKKQISEIPTKYHGISIIGFYIEQMEDIWMKRAPIAILMQSGVERFFEETRPSALLFSDPLEVSQLMAAEARARKIPAMYYNFIEDGHTSTRSLFESNFLHLANEVLVTTEAQKITIEERKGGHTVAVAGSSIQNNQELVDRKELVQNLTDFHGLKSDRPIVLVLSRPVSIALSWVEKEWIFQSVGKVCRSLNLQMVVKGHPYETKSQLLAELERCGVSCPVFIEEYSLDKLISVSSLAVGTPGSASNLHCIYAQVPLVIAATRKTFDRYDYDDGRDAYRRNAAAFCVEYPCDLGLQIQSVLQTPTLVDEWKARAKTFAEKVSGPMDGKAAERVASAFRELSRAQIEYGAKN
jgi:hypothetical protein